MVDAILVMPLGEADPAQVAAAVRRQFAAPQIVSFDRRQLKRQPLRSTLALWRRQFGAAVLVAPDLAQPRLRLTSMLLALPRAEVRWRIDLGGGRERWTLQEHVKQHSGPVARHLIACLLALLLSVPVLTALDARLKPGAPRWLRLALVRLGAAPVRFGAAPVQLGAAPRRILYLRSQLWLGLAGGGSVAHTAGVIGGLEQCGVDVQVVSSDQLPGVSAATRVVPPEVWFDGWLRELEDLGYNVAFTLAALREARLRKSQLLYQRHTTFNVAGAVLSRILRLPLVLEYNSSELWKGQYWGGLRLRRAAALVERINLRAADRVIVVSRVLRDELVAAGVPEAKVVVNPNAADTTRFRPDAEGAHVRQRLGIAPDDIVVGFSGTFGAWHGIPTLARALGLVCKQRPVVRWLLIGDGPLRPLIDQALAADAALRDSVILPGMIRHAEMPDYLAACDILVSPHGRQADGGEFFGSPTKLYEYMAMGRPIVASRVGQIGDVLCDGASALLVTPDDAKALAEAVVRLVDDPALRTRLGSAARVAAENRHTWRQNAQRVLECLGPQ